LTEEEVFEKTTERYETRLVVLKTETTMSCGESRNSGPEQYKITRSFT
jgi:hypothetical protein